METLDNTVTKVILDKNEPVTLTLISTPPPRWATNLLASVMIISFLLPIMGLSLVLYFGTGPKLGLFIAMFFFGAIGYFLFRALHWNYSGKEIIVFTDDLINYQALSNKFKMESREFNRKDASFEIVPHPDPLKINEEKVDAVNIAIHTDEESFELKIRVPQSEIEMIRPDLEKLFL